MQSASPSSNLLPNSANAVSGWRGQWLGVLGLSALLLFTVLPNSYTLMVSWPYCLWWQGAFLLLLLWSIWASRQFSQSLYLLGHRLDWIVLLFLSASVLSTVFAQFRTVAAANLLLIGGYVIVLYVCVNWLRQSPPLKMHLWQALVLVSTLTCSVGLASWRPNAQMWSSHNFYAAICNPWPLGHHNFVGGYCLLLLPIVIGFTLSQSRWQRWAGCGAIVINAIALYISGSRGALLGVLALGIVSLVLYWFYYPHKTQKHWIIISLVSLSLLAMLVSNPRIRAVATHPFSTGTTLSVENITDGPTKDRLFMLQAGQKTLKAHPLLGVGPGNLSRVYNLYRPLQAGSGLDSVQQLHNTPAQLLAELGILGCSAYVLWLATLLKLGFSLHRKITDRADRILLCSIGASWFAYSISSLTDYQLENIGIASTLTVTSALLIDLFGTYLPDSLSSSVAKKKRRLLSLGLLLYLSITVQLWARVDVGLHIATVAKSNNQAFDLAAADTKWTKAAKLVPWDPTYSALATDQLIAALPTVTDADSSKVLTSAAIASLQSTLRAAPNDSFFNQNLAVLSLQTDPVQAEQSMHHALRLFPRTQHYSYYTLGCSYLNQEKSDKAMTAFILEAIANPQFLIDPLWQQAPFSDLLPTVVSATLTAWQSLLATTPLQSSQHAWLTQQISLLQWWQVQPFSASLQTKNPLLQALFQIDKNPESALILLNQIAESSHKPLLIKAWLMPDRYLAPLVENLEITSEEKALLKENIHAHRDIRQWLTSIRQPLIPRQRFGLSFSYRNANANSIRSVLFASGPHRLPLLEQLNLFSPPPREFLQLDQKLAEIGTKSLSLSFPT